MLAVNTPPLRASMARFLAELGQGQEPNRSGNSKHTHKIRNLRIGRTCDVRDVADRPYDAKKHSNVLRIFNGILTGL